MDWVSGVNARLDVGMRQLIERRDVDGDFFLVRLAREVDDVNEAIQHVLESGELFLRDAHSQSELILEAAFSGDSSDVFRGVHFAADSHFMTSRTVSTWSEKVQALVSQGRIQQVRRLVVFTQPNELLNPATREFVVNQAQLTGHAQRSIREGILKAELEAAGLHPPHDFGIYGSRFVFTSSSRNPADLSGSWSTRSETVAAYIEVFDRMWESAENEVFD